MTHAVSDPHFAAYSFVDRITQFDAGMRARGTFAIPAQIDAFPSALVAEAVGQLAAWVAMDAIDFRGRPVAALATETRLLGDATPGARLDLAVDLQQCDDDAVAYDGHASIGGRRIVELADCLGPMLPVADFDSPGALRERLALLRDGGAREGRFDGVDDIAVNVATAVPGKSLHATIDVPSAAPFFADHFPRRPVFPATLLLDLMMRGAMDVARAPEALGPHARATRITHVKMRSFIVPSQRLEVEIALGPVHDSAAKAMLSAKTDGKLVASARLEVVVANDR